MTGGVGCVRVRAKNYGATGFNGGKVTNEATITLWVSKAFKERVWDAAAKKNLSVSEYLRRLANEDMS